MVHILIFKMLSSGPNDILRPGKCARDPDGTFMSPTFFSKNAFFTFKIAFEVEAFHEK